MKPLTVLQKLRQEYVPPLPSTLRAIEQVSLKRGEKTAAVKDTEALKQLFPLTFGQPLVTGERGSARTKKKLRVGVVLSGGQAAGGHNVITGLFDALKLLDPNSQLFGFLNGPGGIIDSKYKELTSDLLASYRNQGGFDVIGSGRTKIETPEQLDSSLATVTALKLDGLVIIGGDDSNTNAAILAEYFLNKKCETKVVGVPKTIDGDLKNAFIATSFGFDTACKVYSEMIGNIARDAGSSKKYYHFIKLMGRSASHIALECALATHPNAALIGEEVAFKKKTLAAITEDLCDMICKRAESGKNYGIILVPEGLIEFIPEAGALIAELNQLAASDVFPSMQEIAAKLTPASLKCFNSLPERIQQQLFIDRDPHGNVQVSLIETERLLIETVGKELEERKKKGVYRAKFNALPHFFGYEGRAGFPSNFDANYCYALGQTAALLVDEGLSGYMCCVGNLEQPVADWTIAGIPITMLMNLEMRKGKSKPVIQKALVDLKGSHFAFFEKERGSWAIDDDYRFPGPIQFFGDPALTDSIPLTLHALF
jgi:diphosphate-dependent phosphofructokinase